ncbi:MAG: hypothetical protein ACOX2L_07810 [Anaerolineae bacterium]|jgi:hypothetical protein
MERPRIVLMALWAALMFTYLLGDVLRLYSGHVQPGELFGIQATQTHYLGIAVFMFVPVLMIILNAIVTGVGLRWINLIITALLFLINVIGVASYQGWYDTFLIICSLGINGLIFWQAYGWGGQ